MRPNGIVLWEGPSRLDGQPIVVIATGLRRGSTNAKTGAMVQTYILLRDIRPGQAVKEGRDASVCGDCPHRSRASGGAGTCYVNVVFGPAAVWKAYQRGDYPQGRPEDLAGLAVRMGAYGDPAAAPNWVWRRIARVAATWRGYSHQWRRRPGLRGVLMASADSLGEAQRAWARGWRTFRVLMPGQARDRNEARCPASAEAGHKVECVTCPLALACNGAGDRKSIAINIHGSPVTLRAAGIAS